MGIQLSQCEAENVNLKECNLRLLSHSKEYQTVITLLEKEKDDLSEQLVENRSRSFTLLADFTFLKDEMNSIASNYSALQIENTSQNDEMDSIRLSHSTLHSENLNHLSHILKLEAGITRLKEENFNLKVDARNNEPPSTSFITENPATLRAISGLEHRGGEYRLGKGGFEEFVLLKKENKTLKLQVIYDFTPLLYLMLYRVVKSYHF
jgi:chromosome segregation ATPase